ncbi:hypothetical protein [Methylorubrum aminovorans]
MRSASTSGPSTATGRQRPSVRAGKAGPVSMMGGAPSYTDAGTPFTILVGPGEFQAQMYGYAGAAVSNSTLSGKTVRATLTYLTD